MNRVQPRIASGFVEYLPAEQIEFNRLLEIIRSTYERYGFSPIDTPDMELSEVLLAKGGGETEQQVYRFMRGRNDFSLRFDLTVPLARYAAQHEADLTFPFRRYHIGKVHRAERAQAGRFREFYQCDIDVIGSESPLVDAEFPAVINEIFEKFGFGEFTIRINNRKVLNGFFESVGLQAQAAQVLRIVDKMEKITSDELHAELEGVGADAGQIESILSFVSIEGDNDQIIDGLRKVKADSATYLEGVEELATLVNVLRKMKVPEARFKVDLRIARGLDYYTGTVYETKLNEYPGLGSVCSGGRYDNLAEYYTETRLPGVGISIGLTRLFYKLLEAGIITPTKQSPADVMVAPMDVAQLDFCLELSAELRAAGIATVLYTEPNTMKKKARYADRMGFKFFIVVGEREAADGAIQVKNMHTRETSTSSVKEFISTIL